MHLKTTVRLTKVPCLFLIARDITYDTLEINRLLSKVYGTTMTSTAGIYVYIQHLSFHVVFFKWLEARLS